MPIDLITSAEYFQAAERGLMLKWMYQQTVPYDTSFDWGLKSDCSEITPENIVLRRVGLFVGKEMTYVL